MAECSDFRAWGELIPDALGLIFRNLPLQEILTVVPRVCKSWSQAVSGPYCWQEIDIEEWSHRCKPEQLDPMLHMLISRSSGSFRLLSVSGIQTDSMLSFIADHAGSLQRLEIPRCEISDVVVEQVASRFMHITFLDLSYCKKMGPRAIEAFGISCKSLLRLRRRMHPLELADRDCQDDEAYTIAKTMPKLRHLEMAYMLLTTRGVLEILSRCTDLEHLDVRGCWEVNLDEKYLKERHASLQVLGPNVVDSYETSLWDIGFSDYSDSESSGYSWELMENGMDVYEGGSDDDIIWEDDQGLEVRFYGGGFTDGVAGFEWPTSP